MSPIFKIILFTLHSPLNHIIIQEVLSYSIFNNIIRNHDMEGTASKPKILHGCEAYFKSLFGTPAGHSLSIYGLMEDKALERLGQPKRGMDA
ncbi:MAG: hypothetical protein A2077_04300 [Nitrospirae bacterium GWC2_46_6]|nr:MAG: hypothetical protein A2077_04300 [Nitrospirae bacterium GWC2_46_6]HAK89548.1 hypothetical protein [Nitrospiraceae bacterium]